MKKKINDDLLRPVTAESIREAKEAQWRERAEFEAATGYRIDENGNIIAPTKQPPPH